MSNVLSEAKKQQVIALGRLGWPLRRIEQETGVRRETAGAYLKAAGIGVRPPGAWGRRPPAKAANASVETWFIAQAFKLTSSDTATFNSFIAEELVHAEQYDNILFFGWQYVSELDRSSVGANFSPETKQLYQKYLKK